MGKKTTNQPPRSSIDLKLLLIDRLSSLAETVAKWGVGGFIVYCITNAIIALAGESTTVELKTVFSFILEQNVTQILFFTFGVSGTLYGLVERKLRKAAIRRLESHPRNLELKIDQNRTSSLLTQDGSTRPEDE